MPVIGALTIVIGCELILGRLPHIRLVLRTSPLSAAAMVVTFLATTQLALQQAIVIGAVLSLLLYCVQAARQSGLHALEPAGPDSTVWRVASVPARIEPGTTTVLQARRAPQRGCEPSWKPCERRSAGGRCLVRGSWEPAARPAPSMAVRFEDFY
ncbi:MAG TPA: hypothetical protein VIS09_31315 [Streptomyces sp.]